MKKLIFLAVNSICCLLAAESANQTPDVSPIFPNDLLPFHIRVELADFQLPNGIHSFSQAIYGGKWLFIAGRTNGLHGFEPDNNNFPPSAQNRLVYVVDPATKMVFTRSLTDPSSGLTQEQIDTLSVTAPQNYVSGQTLYITGGYGVDSATGLFSTKSCLTAIDIPGLMHWVISPGIGETAAQHIRQIFHPVFQVTGGEMFQFKGNPTLLALGQNFDGFYHDDSNGIYSELIRRFHIIDDGKNLGVKILSVKPKTRKSWLRRRDLNIVPIIRSECGKLKSGLVAYSGVFTLQTGVWTVPVVIDPNGKPKMPDPDFPLTFKQGMNNYNCAYIGLFSEKGQNMYSVFLGGISFGFFADGVFQTSSRIPFINQITTVNFDRFGFFTQYLMDAQYPVILSTQSNPGNQLLFGANAIFIPAEGINVYENDILNFDSLEGETFIGYIVGGIQSTMPNTNTQSDSAASPYIFKVTFIP
jgi:hypothetical protein